MRRASVGDLRFRFGKIERLLRRGEEILITRRGEVVARLVPEEALKYPDFLGRLKAIYSKKMLKVSGAELIRRDRDRY